MGKLEALIFDVDGTLADTERDGHRVAFNRAFAEAGLDWNWSAPLYGELLSVTGGKERILHYIGRYQPKLPSGGTAKFVADLHAAKTRHYVRLLEEGGIPLRPGVKRLLSEARDRGLRLAIATTTAPANVTALLEANLPGGASWFEVIGAGDIVPAKKPAPDIYRYVLRELALGPDRCLAIEDSAHGLHSALGAGVATAVTVNGYTADQDFAGALLVLDRLGEPGAPFQVLAWPAVPPRSPRSAAVPFSRKRETISDAGTNGYMGHLFRGNGAAAALGGEVHQAGYVNVDLLCALLAAA